MTNSRKKLLLIGHLDTVFEKEIIDLFFHDTAGHMDELRRAIADKAKTDVEATAHAIRGAAANLGAEKLCRLTHDIELKGRDGFFETMVQDYDHLI